MHDRGGVVDGKEGNGDKQSVMGCLLHSMCLRDQGQVERDQQTAYWLVTRSALYLGAVRRRPRHSVFDGRAE